MKADMGTNAKTVEEKAMAYDRALEIAKKKQISITDDKFLTELFPELKKSELKESEDERIKRLLLKGFKNYGSRSAIFSGLSCGEIIDWLEKLKFKRIKK